MAQNDSACVAEKGIVSFHVSTRAPSGASGERDCGGALFRCTIPPAINVTEYVLTNAVITQNNFSSLSLPIHGGQPIDLEGSLTIAKAKDNLELPSNPYTDYVYKLLAVAIAADGVARSAEKLKGRYRISGAHKIVSAASLRALSEALKALQSK